MLPPVHATLSSFVEYQTPQQQPMQRQRIDANSNPVNIGTVSSASLSGGRLDILSLSAQLQLAQGLSVFAETIGKIIKVPRREGEAVADYTQRLADAIKAMNPADKAALERTLNQLVKGISLRLLAEILTNPDGPEAARFAMQLETAQLLERDFAAKAVVSSYRQNAGAEQASGTPRQQPAPPVPAAPAAPAGGIIAEAAALPAQQADAAPLAAEIAQSETGASELVAEPEAGLPQAATFEAIEVAVTTPATSALAAEIEAVATLQIDNGVSHAQDATEAAPLLVTAAEQDAAAELVEAGAPELLEAIKEETPHEPSTAARSRDGSQEPGQGVSNDRRSASPVFYDGPALARLSQREPEQLSLPMTPRAPLNADKPVVAAMTEWLAEALAEGGGDLFENLPAAAATRLLPEQRALEQLLDSEFLARAPMPAKDASMDAMMPRQAAQAPVDPQTTSSVPHAAGNTAAANGQSSTPAELAAQIPLPLPLPVPREGIALPYIAYPLEERERDPEERKTRAISATDEDGEQQHSGEQASADDGAPDHHAEEEEQPEVLFEEAEEATRANTLYWRMAGWA